MKQRLERDKAEASTEEVRTLNIKSISAETQTQLNLSMESVTALRERISALETELAETRDRLRDLEESSSPGKQDIDSLPFRLDEYRRYGRQMILDDFGLSCVFPN